MAQDIIQFEILEDGTIKTTTDPISAANHYSADELLKAIDRAAGGEVTITKRHKHAHAHIHAAPTVNQKG